MSLDPDYRKYPSLSPYAFAANDPVRYIDEFGKGPGDKVVMFSGAILIPGYQKPTATMYHIMDKVSKFNGATTMYNTTYPLGLVDDNKGMIENAVADIKTWKVANPDGKLTIFGYSYGGVAAMDLTRALDKAGIKVDLLITLDAADGNNSNKVDRTIPGNVVKNINYYQTNAKQTGSRLKNLIGSQGGANSRVKGNDKTIIQNINDTKGSYYGKEDYNDGKIDHYNIDDKNKDTIVDDVRQTEGECIPDAPSKCLPEKL